MKLQPLMTMRGDLRQPSDVVGNVPLGRRMISEVSGGSFEGDRLAGTLYVKARPPGTPGASTATSTKRGSVIGA